MNVCVLFGRVAQPTTNLIVTDYTNDKITNTCNRVFSRTHANIHSCMMRELREALVDGDYVVSKWLADRGTFCRRTRKPLPPQVIHLMFVDYACASSLRFTVCLGWRSHSVCSGSCA